MKNKKNKSNNTKIRPIFDIPVIFGPQIELPSPQDTQSKNNPVSQNKVNPNMKTKVKRKSLKKRQQ